jgi:GH18 family chitinase
VATAPSVATAYPTGFSTSYPTAVYSNCPDVADVMTINFGYYQSLAAYRAPTCNQLLPGDIDVAGAGYTHIAYSFVGIDANYSLAPWNDDYETEVPMYREFNSHKAKIPNLKTIVSIGGWTFNNPGLPSQNYFSDITNNATLRTHFAASVVDFLEKVSIY